MGQHTHGAGRRYAAPAWIDHYGLWLVVAVFVVLGIMALAVSRAANGSVAAEAEAGVIAGNADKLDGQAGASGSGAVIFGRPLQYVSLGDSVASGDGIEYGWKWTPDGAGDGSWVRTGPAQPVWEPASDSQPAVQACHRSKQAYPYQLAAVTGYRHYNPSCSGSSVLDGVLGARVFSSSLIGATQVGSNAKVAGYAPANPAYDAFKPDVITITLGMNDINFVDFLRRCYVGTTCVTAENEQDVTQRLAKFKTDLVALLDEIKARGTAASRLPAVVLTNYYDPFHPDSNKSCKDTVIGLGNGIGPNEVVWLRSKMQSLNQVIGEAAATYPKVKLADISKALAGHELCSGQPWVYGVSIWYSDFGNPAPFHPTPEGHQAIANAIKPLLVGFR